MTEELKAIARRIRPADCCLVPERREELTTEGGLDVASRQSELTDYCGALAEAGIRVSLFIDPNPLQVEASLAIGVPVVEIHTGGYAETRDPNTRAIELDRIHQAVALGTGLGLQVNAGHGLDYHKVRAIAAIPGILELNSGHAIIARALFSGLDRAVRDMKSLLIRS